MKVLICGDRKWKNVAKIKEMVRYIKIKWPDVVIIEGDAMGADRIAGACAEALGVGHKKFPAEWERYRKGAGPIRNRKMLDEQPGLVIAFHNQLHLSKGTKDCVTEARRRGIPVLIITEEDEINAKLLDPYNPEVCRPGREGVGEVRVPLGSQSGFCAGALRTFSSGTD